MIGYTRSNAPHDVGIDTRRVAVPEAVPPARERDMDHLFVYGTLLSGVATPAMAALMARMQFVGPATLPGRLYDLGPYPAVVPDSESSDSVRGELYAVPRDAALFPLLDQYEGHFPDRPAQSLFRRVRAGVTRGDGQPVTAWVYVWNRDIGTAKPIPEGDFRAARVAKGAAG